MWWLLANLFSYSKFIKNSQFIKFDKQAMMQLLDNLDYVLLFLLSCHCDPVIRFLTKWYSLAQILTEQYITFPIILIYV